MAGYSNAGRVLIIHKGAFKSGTTYTSMDSVLYKGTTYICKAASVTATKTPNTDTANWQILANGMDTEAFTALQTKVNTLRTDFDNLFEVTHTW